MTRIANYVLAGLAPAVWGSTYIITTETLPAGYPLTVSVLRALPAGLLLLVLVRQLPSGMWIPKILLLGALNFSFFWWMLFEAAYRLPGGVAATVGAMQPLIVIFLAYSILNIPIRLVSVAAALLGMFGVGLLILTSNAELDFLGVCAALAGAASMAAGTVLTRKWRPEVSLLTFTAWQLTAGGLLLVPAALLFEPPLPPLTPINIAGLLYLCLIGAALTYILWFRGIRQFEPSAISTLGFLSPLSAVLLGWLILDQTLTITQIFGIVIVAASIWISQNAHSNNNKTDTVFRKKAGQGAV